MHTFLRGGLKHTPPTCRMQHQRPVRVDPVSGPEGGERSDRGPTPTLDSDDDTDTAPVSSSRVSPGMKDMKDPMSPQVCRRVCACARARVHPGLGQTGSARRDTV